MITVVCRHVSLCVVHGSHVQVFVGTAGRGMQRGRATGDALMRGLQGLTGSLFVRWRNFHSKSATHKALGVKLVSLALAWSFECDRVPTLKATRQSLRPLQHQTRISVL